MDISVQPASLKKVDCIGILLPATEMEKEDFELFKDFNVPIVVLDCYYDELEFDCVLINNIQGAFNATNYLIDCGHKRVGYLRSSIKISNFSERAGGYYKALRAHGHEGLPGARPQGARGYFRHRL